MSRKSAYSQLSEETKNRYRRSALAYYHRNRANISVKRKHERDTNPQYKIKRQKREDSPKYRAMRRNYHLQKHYGISLDLWNSMYASQRGKCAICLVHFDTLNEKDVHIDHNHSSGQIRQLLCTKCNHAIGNLNENPVLFHRAIRYLKKWK